MFKIGDVIDDQYRLVRLIGEGGQGTVFEAEDVEIAAPLAIKVLKREVGARVDWVTRLRREARAMGMLSGTAAVQIYALNETKNGHLYLVMELLRGQDLEHYLRKYALRSKSVPVKVMLDVLSPIAKTLEVAHSRSIVHRDIKPANIFVLESDIRGRVRLLDFGMVKDLTATTQLTTEGFVVGSPSYIPPEGWYGKSSMITHAADVYAMGVLVFRILSGHVPFSGDDLPEVVKLVMKGRRPSLRAERPDLPRGIDAWVERALAVEPKDRFASIQELWSELQSMLQPDDFD